MESILGHTVGFFSGNKVWDELFHHEHYHMHLAKKEDMKSSSQHALSLLHCLHANLHGKFLQTLKYSNSKAEGKQ